MEAQYQYFAQYGHFANYKSTIYHNGGNEFFTLTTDGVSVKSCGDTMKVEVFPKVPEIASKYSLYRCLDQNCNSKEFVKFLDSNVFYISPKEFGYSVSDASTSVVWYDYVYPVRAAEKFDNIYFLNQSLATITTISPTHFANDTILAKDPDYANPYMTFALKNWIVNGNVVNDIKSYSLANGDSVFVTYDFSQQTYPCTYSKTFFAAKVEDVQVGINKVAQNVISVSPNPINHSFVIRSGNSNEKFQLLSLSGQVVKTDVLANTSVDASALKQGIYFIQSLSEQSTEPLKVMISH